MSLDLRDKDIAVLEAIEDGASSVTEIKEATTLSTREINYSLTEKGLEQQGLVEIHRPEGREWQEINGHKRNLWKPKTISPTDQGIQLLAELDTDQVQQYDNMSRDELVKRVRELEHRQDRFEAVFKDFRGKVMERI